MVMKEDSDQHEAESLEVFSTKQKHWEEKRSGRYGMMRRGRRGACNDVERRKRSLELLLAITSSHLVTASHKAFRQ